MWRGSWEDRERHSPWRDGPHPDANEALLPVWKRNTVAQLGYMVAAFEKGTQKRLNRAWNQQPTPDCFGGETMETGSQQKTRPDMFQFFISLKFPEHGGFKSAISNTKSL